MRTFIAIDIPPTGQILNLYNDITANLKGINVKYTDTNQYHITLSFLGETSASQVEEISNSLESLDIKTRNNDIHLYGLGVFGNWQKPSSIWIGIKPNTAIETLWLKVNELITSFGFKTDERKFSPHLTAGRVKSITMPHNLETFKEKYQNYSFGESSLTEFVFYQSILTQQGPIYRPIKRFKV